MSSPCYPHKYLHGWTAVVALVICIGGLLSIVEGAGTETGLPVHPDIMGGCILLLLAALLGSGFLKGQSDRPAWVSYSYVGSLLMLIFAGCMVFMGIADTIALLLEEEPLELVWFYGSAFIWGGLLSIPLYTGSKALLYGCSEVCECHE